MAKASPKKKVGNAKTANAKKEQYENQMKDELNLLLRTGMKNTNLSFVSITRVEINADYSIATAYWDTFDLAKRGTIKEALEGAVGKMRTHLANTLKIRHTPIIKVRFDSSFEDEAEITNLLEEEKKEGRDF